MDCWFPSEKTVRINPDPVMTSTKSNRPLPDSLRLLVDTTQADIANLLLDMPIFEDLERRDVDILSRHFKLYEVQPGSVLFNEGDEGDFMAMIVEGAVDVLKHPEDRSVVKVASAGLGKMVGEMALVDGQPRSASAEFSKRSRILILTRESFEAVLTEYEHAGIGLLWRLCRILSQRLRQTTGMLYEKTQAS